MISKILISTAAVFVLWSVLDFLLHGMLLQGAYASTASLWRPQSEIRYGVLYFSTLVTAIGFCSIWTRMVAPKSANTGFWYGLWWGIARGVGMGFGTYAVQPIPYFMAMSWFVGCAIAGALAGLLVAALVRDPSV